MHSTSPAAVGDRSRSVLGWIAAVAIPIVLMGVPIWSGDGSFIYFRESVDQTWGWMQKLAQAWQAGYLPLWNANTQAGHSFVGEIQPGVFYPLHWLWLVLFERDGRVGLAPIENLVVLHFAIAAAGMYGLLRQWRLTPAAALGGALCFALTGPVAMRAIAQANIFYSIAWLPWVMWAAARFLDRRRPIDGLATGALLGLQVAAGHVQPAIHAALLVAAMSLLGARARHGAWRPALRDAMALAGWSLPGILLIAGPQLLLTQEYSRHAYRWMTGDHPVGPGGRMRYADFAYAATFAPRDFGNLIDPWQFVPTDYNFLWIGTLPLLLAIWFLGAPARRQDVDAWRLHGPWLLAIAVFAGLAMLGHHTFVAALIRPLPGGTMIRQLARHALLLHVVLCIAFACALQALAQGHRIARPARWLLVVGSLQLVWLLIADPAVLTRNAAWHLAIACFALGVAWTWPARRSLAVMASLAALGFHVVSGTAKFVPIALDGRTPTPLVETAGNPIVDRLAGDYGRYRVMVDASTGWPRNYALVHRLQARDGYGASMHVATHDYLMQDWGRDARSADLMNLRWLVSRDDQPLREVMRDAESGLKLYERNRWMPRIFLRSQLDSDGPDIERELALQVLEYSDHVQRFRIEVAHPDEAIVAELDYPGWCATVNGNAVEIRPAAIDGIKPWHRAVTVPAGSVELAFRYRPLQARFFGCPG